MSKTDNIYRLACELKRTQDALDTANHNLQSHGLLGVVPDIGGPTFDESKKFYADVKRILKEFGLHKKKVKDELVHRVFKDESSFKSADKILANTLNALLMGKFAQSVVLENVDILKELPQEEWAKFIVRKTAEKTFELYLDQED